MRTLLQSVTDKELQYVWHLLQIRYIYWYKLDKETQVIVLLSERLINIVLSDKTHFINKSFRYGCYLAVKLQIASDECCRRDRLIHVDSDVSACCVCNTTLFLVCLPLRLFSSWHKTGYRFFLDSMLSYFKLCPVFWSHTLQRTWIIPECTPSITI